MKRIGILGLAAFLVVLLAGTALAAAAVDLGTAKSFAVLAGETITNTGATTITGDVGLHPGKAATGFETVTLHGAKHLGDAVALGAKNALVTAYDDAAGATPVTNVPVELGGTTLKPGVYASDTLGLTGTLTLDGEGLYIFQAASTLITAPDSKVALINGASACNVYWQVGSSATLDTGTSFKGTIMALTSITLNNGATLQGRALARNGAVTMDHNTINSSACAVPSPTPTPVPSPTPKATPTSGTHTAAPLPATDTIAATPAAITDRVSATFLALLVIATIALVGSLRIASIRARPRD
jgi:cell division septation protein DedD